MKVISQGKRLAAAGVLFLVVGALASGCGKKEDTAAAAPPASLKGQTPTAPTGVVKGTPEQEAAKAKAMQEGPAIEAALKAQQEGNAPPK